MKISKQQLRRMIREEIGSASTSSKKRRINERTEFTIDGTDYSQTLDDSVIKDAFYDALFFSDDQWTDLAYSMGIEEVLVSIASGSSFKNRHLTFNVYHGLDMSVDPDRVMTNLELHYDNIGVLQRVNIVPPDVVQVVVSISIG